MLLGHLTNTFVIGDITKRVYKDINLPFLVFGALIPDLIDKPLAAIYDISGRGIAHSLIVHVILLYIAFRFLKIWRSAVLAMCAGCIIHLIQDWPDIHTLFWPLLGTWKVTVPTTLFQKMYGYYILRIGSVKWFIELFSILYIIIQKLKIRDWFWATREVA